MMNNHTQSVVQQLLDRLKADSRSDSEIAELSTVSQPTVWRLRRSDGTRRRLTEQFNKLCSFYGIPTASFRKVHQSYGELLQEAIIDVWDGTDANAHALLHVIRGLKGLNKQPDKPSGEPLDHT